MKRTFVSAAIHPGKFDKNKMHWPVEDGWSAEVEIANEEINPDGSRLYINESVSYQHWQFTKVWEFVARQHLDCFESKP